MRFIDHCGDFMNYEEFKRKFQKILQISKIKNIIKEVYEIKAEKIEGE